MSSKITIILAGLYPNDLFKNIKEYSDLQVSVITTNILDYALPPKVEKGATQHYRHEILNVLKLMNAAKHIPTSTTLLNLLKENDRLGLTEDELIINAHIEQIETNASSLVKAYDILIQETKVNNLTLLPMFEDNPQIYAFKNKKYAPLRYYQQSKILLSESVPDVISQSKKKSDKKLQVIGLDSIKDLKLTEATTNTIEESDLILFIPTDIVTLGVLSFVSELSRLLKKSSAQVVFLSYINSEIDDILKEIGATVEIGLYLSDYAEYLGEFTDYVIIDRSNKEYLEHLIKAECRVIQEDLFETENNDDIIKTIFRIGSILDSNSEQDKTVVTKNLDSASSENNETNDNSVNSLDAKPLSQLIESEEEAGLLKTISPSDDTSAVSDAVQVNNNLEENSKFEENDDEDWSVALDRAISDIIDSDEFNQSAYDWIQKESEEDVDQKIQIAEKIINKWVSAKNIVNRRKITELLSKVASNHKDTYKQIIQKIMITAVINKDDLLGRKFLPLFSVLNEVDTSLAEELLKDIIEKLALIEDINDNLVMENIKLTILQLVIPSRRLSKIATGTLLNIIATKENYRPELWNMLIAFDAGTVALELATRYSLEKAEEIIRKANLLRFTGSYYSVLTNALKAMKEGDINLLSHATGQIIPENTIRRFERLNLARKVEKVNMVQLEVLADSIGKDVKYVERLITELIVNDEIQAELQYIDDKMYIVSIKK